ncbi:MAG: hypothetical protein JWL71_3438, partial [Acidobacteria bacterium]|nr:hypothetical protein [Acidobacteriota bacterium]
MRRSIRSVGVGFACGAALLLPPTVRAEQQPPPIQGVTGTIALEGTIDQTSEAGKSVIVKTVDGMRHLFHVTEKTVVHGSAAADADVLGVIEPGTRIVVHFTANAGRQTAVEVDRLGAAGLKTVEGVVTRVDRDGRQLSIHLADGTTQTLRLTDRAAADVGRDVESAATVVVYYADEGGHQVAHYFKKIS